MNVDSDAVSKLAKSVEATVRESFPDFAIPPEVGQNFRSVQAIVDFVWENIPHQDLATLSDADTRRHLETYDAAGGAAEEDSTTVGGIDLNPDLLDLQIKRDARGVPLPFNMQPVMDMKIEGFLPVIIQVTPISNIPMLLGIADKLPSSQPYQSAQGKRQEDLPGLLLKKRFDIIDQSFKESV